jgi:ribosomal protein S18 acetylase RimI-like enzyme
MKLKAIVESPLLEFKGRVEIVPWSDEPYDYNYDPWVAADQADKIAAKSGIRISSNKELSLIAVNESDDVVGAVWSFLSNDDPPIFDFDVVVDPKWRSGRLGLRLIDSAIEDLRAHQSDFPDTYARVWVVNPKLVRVLESRYGFEIESQYENGSAHMTFA